MSVGRDGMHARSVCEGTEAANEHAEKTNKCVEDANECWYCGREYPEESVYCELCGNKLDGSHDQNKKPYNLDTLLDSGFIFERDPRWRYVRDFTFPDAPGVPGKILSVEVVHRVDKNGESGLMVYSVDGGKAQRNRTTNFSTDGWKPFPKDWFKKQSCEFDETHQHRLAELLQGFRFCDHWERWDNLDYATGSGPICMIRIVFDDDGFPYYFSIRTNPWDEADESTCCAREIVGIIEDAFGDMPLPEGPNLVFLTDEERGIACDGQKRVHMRKCPSLIQRILGKLGFWNRR